MVSACLPRKATVVAHTDIGALSCEVSWPLAVVAQIGPPGCTKHSGQREQTRKKTPASGNFEGAAAALFQGYLSRIYVDAMFLKRIDKRKDRMVAEETQFPVFRIHRYLGAESSKHMNIITVRCISLT